MQFSLQGTEQVGGADAFDTYHGKDVDTQHEGADDAVDGLMQPEPRQGHDAEQIQQSGNEEIDSYPPHGIADGIFARTDEELASIITA